jgi:hypothetical protein
MHASICTFPGDPDDLLARYDAMLAEVPAANMRLHLCLRADDGIVIVDTCPSQEVFAAFFAPGGPFRSLLARHGLPEPRIEDHPVHVAITDGVRVAA